jgi:transcriptional regulator with XRE-family HTH domain
MLGRHLREARLEAGLTQEQLAQAARVDRTYISMLEREERSPTMAVFFDLCHALAIKPSTLVARAEGEYRPQSRRRRHRSPKS